MSSSGFVAVLLSICIFYAVFTAGEAQNLAALSISLTTTPTPTATSPSAPTLPTATPTAPTNQSTSPSAPTLPPTTPTTPTNVSTSPSPPTQPTSTNAPKPTPAPEAKFPDNVANWNFTDLSDNVTCIKVRGALQIAFDYTDANNKTLRMPINIPKENFMTSGACGKENQTLSVVWASPLNETQNNSILFTFKKTENHTMVSLVELTTELTFTANSSEPIQLKFDSFTNAMEIPFNTSFSCNSEMNFIGHTASATLRFAKFQYQAFAVKTSTEFENAKVCSADESVTSGMGGWAITGIVFGIIAAVALVGGLFYYQRERIRVCATNAYDNM